ncbi:MAG TPA: OmpA family protein, partial [bacterium]|nr:OmpA family protein [bacterium]
MKRLPLLLSVMLLAGSQSLYPLNSENLSRKYFLDQAGHYRRASFWSGVLSAFSFYGHYQIRDNGTASLFPLALGSVSLCYSLVFNRRIREYETKLRLLETEDENPAGPEKFALDGIYRNLKKSERSSYIGWGMALAGLAIYLDKKDEIGSTYQNIGISAMAGGILFQFPVSHHYVKKVEEDLVRMDASFKTAPEPLEKNETEEKKIIEEIRNIEGIEVQEGLEIEKFIFVSQASYLGMKEGNPEISSEGYDTLSRIARFIKENPRSPVEVAGHARETGEREKDTETSAGMAQKVRDFYVEIEGIPSESISAAGYGSQQPLDKDKPEWDSRVETAMEIPRTLLNDSSKKSLLELGRKEGVMIRHHLDSLQTRMAIGEKAVYFGFNSSNIDDKFFPLLDIITRLVMEKKKSRVYIEGHTDSAGGKDYNLTLSARRARSVMDYLIGKGVEKDRML